MQLSQRNIYELLLAHSLTGTLSNVDLMKEGQAPERKAEIAALMAIMATDSTIRLLNEREEYTRQKNEELKAKKEAEVSEVLAEEAKEEPAEVPLAESTIEVVKS
jgi:hypothetical protein